jgi:membrane protease YdiL (CAAX protease family)
LTARTNPGLLADVSPLQLAALFTVACLALCALTGRLAFLVEEFSAPWRRAVAGVLFAGILAAVVFYPMAGGSRLATVDVDELSLPTLFLGHGLLILFLLGWWVLRQFPSRGWSALPFDHVVTDIRYGIGLGLAGWLITIAVTMSVAAIAIATGATPAPREEIPPVMVCLAELPVSHKLLIIAVAMTVEEWFFRGFLQRRIGLVVSSVLFMLAHASYGLPFMMVSVLTISLLIGRALQRRGRLLPCIVAHGVFDAIQLLIILPVAVRLIHPAS